MVTHLEDLCFALKSKKLFSDFEAVNLRDTSIPRPWVQCEAPKIAKLVYNSNNYGLWYLQL